MTALLLDTHAWVWSLMAPEMLSDAARSAILGADAVMVSPISFYEIGQKVRLGKWPEMLPHADRLDRLLAEQGGISAPFTPAIALHASLRDWAHRDPFDRMLASTAELAGLTLVSRDPVFGDLPAVGCLW
ncbi:MAG: PIN domain nuclease [Rhodobacteraceae bacterium PARR1]|nr:MAG: PIN domain nuclease [Rhodobacteraceae bacterium PARR1]